MSTSIKKPYPDPNEELKELTLTLWSTGKFDTKAKARKKAKEMIQKRKELQEYRRKNPSLII